MTREEALKVARMQAIMSGGVYMINGQKLTSQNGFWYLDDQQVVNKEEQVLQYVKIEERYVEDLMKESADKYSNFLK